MFILPPAVHECLFAPHPHPLNVIVLLVLAILWGGLPLLFICTCPSSSHKVTITCSHTGWSVLGICLTSCKIPEAQLLPCPFFSQVVFPHHWPHGHLHIHRSHSGLRWPLLCLGESPFYPLWRVPRLKWKVGLSCLQAAP